MYNVLAVPTLPTLTQEEIAKDLITQIERELSIRGMTDALRALDMVIEKMSSKNGFKRHDGSEYYLHCIQVALILLRFGFRHDENLIISALLHDIVEDVPGYSVELLEREFNSTVANTVKLLTKEKDVDYKNNPEKMIEYLTAILGDWRATLIKTADRIHNFFTLYHSSFKHRKAQLENTMTYFIWFFEEGGRRYVRHEGFYSYAITTIVPLAKEIQRYIEDFEAMEKELNYYKKQCKKCE